MSYLIPYADSDIIRLTEFLNLFKHDRFGSKISNCISKEFLEDQKLQFIEAVNTAATVESGSVEIE